MKNKSKNKTKNIDNDDKELLLSDVINSAIDDYVCNANNRDGTFCDGIMKLEGNVYVCNKCERWEYSSS